jgi:hypothetical protein
MRRDAAKDDFLACITSSLARKHCWERILISWQARDKYLVRLTATNSKLKEK